MPAGLNAKSPHRQGRQILAALGLACCLACTLAVAQTPVNLDQKLVEIGELGRYLPAKALGMLLEIEAQARSAPDATKIEFLDKLGLVRRGLRQDKEALASVEELLAMGRSSNNKIATTKGLLAKGYILFAMDQFKQAHQLTWDAEKIADTTDNIPLRVQAKVSSGQSYAEEGNFPLALAKLQSAAAMARQYEQPIPIVMAFNALAQLYSQMQEFDKGFAALDEAAAVVEQTNSVGRMASLKETEYVLAIGSGQPKRGQQALLSALTIERKLGAETLIAYTLVNLSDSYLKQNDYPRAINYANQAMQAGQQINNAGLVATASINIGQAYLGMGRLAEGKRSFEAGLEWYEKSDSKPELQSVLIEYGAALERAGDVKGAVAAYHRERTLSNQLFKQERQKAIWELQGKYEADKKEHQIVLLSRENQVKSAELDVRRLQQRVWWLLLVVFALAAIIVGILYRKVRQANAQLHVKNLELKQQSALDPLTCLYNRRHFQEFMRSHLDAEPHPSADSEIVGALFLLDVDHFKHVNDRFGHAAGDAVLKMIASKLRVILRETDMIVRWGGEEFLAFLPAIPRSGMDEIARRLLVDISSHVIDYQGTKISVNVSIGFAPFPLSPGAHPLPWERAVNLVDMALYMAKAHGRNRAYGVRGFANFEQTSMENIEQDLERAWRAGFVDLSVVLGGWPEPKLVPVTVTNVTNV
jgi:diguanylate cyclase (GGDEF)-like protein